MISIIQPVPWTNINDTFIKTDRINASAIPNRITHPVVSSPVVHLTNYVEDFYSKIAVDIVTETVFNYPYPIITEKTLTTLIWTMT